MHKRASELIEILRLKPHPEGGYFSEVFRAPESVDPADGRPLRSSLTAIFFLLPAGELSRWHRVKSAEVWHCFEGDPLELVILDPSLETPRRRILGPAGKDRLPLAVVPAGWWQAARTEGEYTLVGCTVAPGFEFEDFTLMSDEPEAFRLLRERHPGLTTFL